MPRSRNLPCPSTGGPHALYNPTLTGILLIYLNHYPEHLLGLHGTGAALSDEPEPTLGPHSNALPSCCLGRCGWVFTR